MCAGTDRQRRWNFDMMRSLRPRYRARASAHAFALTGGMHFIPLTFQLTGIDESREGLVSIIAVASQVW